MTAEAGKKGEKMKRRKPTIAELEKILNSGENLSIKILPNGEVRAVKKRDPKKILTLHEDLGGEY